ncbi:hypothetical protein PRUPE_7G073100 [Prunus persica]|uniref:Uncharacterized protein n=1 Tax=Prunus persica TaxID=3760 RepID=A0A251N802_PRUPE|nr:uncharacterized protein At2g29880 [Prunus persica]ONH95470.1 hypothetical protein PRUPE_7G073100 [Prunus persica]
MGDCEQVTGKGKAKKDYSAWSVEESKMLLQLMVDVASRGWRDANGVLSKATVETKILPILNEKLGCQKTYCHYQSRLKYFKREYQKYSQLMRHNSGFGWDSTTKKFTAPEEIWEDYFKSHPTHRHIQTKTCEDYEDLQIVIGNAAVSGKNSLGLGDGTDARTFGVEDRQVGIEDFVYDNDTRAFVPNHNEASHQDPPLGHSSSSLPFQANIWTSPSESSSQRKRTRPEHEGNGSQYETCMDRISFSIAEIATDFKGVHSLLGKREKDRERQSYIWDVIKETPNMDERARYKALSLLNITT